MVDSGRRSFLMGAGGVAIAACSAGTEPVSASVDGPPVRPSRAVPRMGQTTANIAVPADLSALIDRERERIRRSLHEDAIPGAAVCLIHAGQQAWIEGFGVTDRKAQRPVTDRTIFSIQSTSKNFTATAILLAVQKGLLHLDEPIGHYIPDFTILSLFDPAPQARMTLRLLLSHRAGFTHEGPVGNNYDAAFPDFESHVRGISRTWLRHPVGERYRYSNLGIDVAGYILQTVCRIPFPECLKAFVFAPLGMSDTTVAPQEYERRRDRAVGHAKGHDTVPLRTPLIPSGGVYTSARDVAAYLRFHLNRGAVDGKPLLEERLWNEMHSFPFGGDYSLCVQRTELRYGDTPIRMLSHAGGGFGFGSVFKYCPEAQFAWAAFFNQQGDAGYLFGTELVESLLTRQYGPRRPRLPASDLSTIEPAESQLESFVGRYVGRQLSGEMKLSSGKLGLQAGQAFTPLQFTSPVDVFTIGSTGETVASRYYPSTAEQVAHFECWDGEYSLDYNDGPHDKPGPDKPEWQPYIGDYQVFTWGQPSMKVSIHRQNGYLYLNDLRLPVELEPGLFFTCDGEAVDFRSTEPTWRNISLQR